MGRRVKPPKGEEEAKRSRSVKSPKNEDSRVRDLEKRLAEALKLKTEALKREAEALEQHTATSEILRVISSSPTDIQPVLDALAESAARLCDATDAVIQLRDADQLIPRAHFGPIPHAASVPVVSGSVSGRVAIDGRTIHIHDLMAVENDDEFPVGRAFALQDKVRTHLATPLWREGIALGVILIRRAEVRPFSEAHISLLKTFADQAVIAIENVRLFKELEARNRDLSATSEILRVISSSPTDVQPVFDAIALSAMRLCDATFCNVARYDGDLLHLAAHAHTTAEGIEAMKQLFPMRPSRATALGRAVFEAAVAHLPDLQRDAEYSQPLRAALRARSALGVPLLRDGQPIGAIAVGRSESHPFTQDQIALLQTFADQAVIAIENVRLFTKLQASNRELTTALDTQTATSDILRVISRSQTDVQPVFDAILTSAVRLLGAYSGVLTRIAGDQIELAAFTSTDDAGDAVVRAHFPQSLQSEEVANSAVGPHAQAVRDRAPLNFADAYTDPRLPEGVRAAARARGFRSTVVVPLLRHDEAVGTIAVSRRELGGFTDDGIALLKTFADQAVIAIENVRLFTELQQKNQALTEAHAQVSETLEQQTATAEVLRVIAAAQTDVQPVFDTITANALRLCAAHGSGVYRFDGELIHVAALRNIDPGGVEAVRRAYPMLPNRGGATGRAILTRSLVSIPDVREDPEYQLQGTAAAVGYRSILAVPMLREGNPIGAITVNSSDVFAFSDTHVELLRTFADQAVIAIENVRLFTELQEKNRALTQAHAQVTEALEQQTATSEILRVISQSPTDVQPVFDAIVRNAVRLCDAMYGLVYRSDGEQVYLAAHHNFTPQQVGEWQQTFPRPINDSGASVHVIRTGVVLRVADVEIQRDSPISETGRALLRSQNARSVLIVPMFRQNEVIGSITLTHRDVGAFTDAHVELLKTFADQAVIAIENVRLFTELQEKNSALTQAHAHVTEALEQQTATSEILRVISSSPTDTRPVFEGIARSGVRVCGALGCAVFVIEDDVIRVAATHGVKKERLERFRTQFPAPVSAEPEFTRVIREGLFHLADIANNPEATAEQIEYARLAGYRTRLMVPMLRGADVLGVIAVTREDASPFSDQQVELLKTFADQAVIAIENVRLFNETKEALEQQTATSEILRVISSSPTDIQPVLDAVIRSAARLCEAYDAWIGLREGENLRVRAHEGPIAVAEELRPIKGGRVSEAAVLDRRPVHVHDLAASGAEFPQGHADALRIGHRTALGVPLLREGEAIGVILIRRLEVRPFTDKQITLLQTFADQAVIAIENVRLFKELEARNSALTESLEQQTATSEILQVISSSPTDIQPVFDTIVRNAASLCDASLGGLHLFDGEQITLNAYSGVSEEEVAFLQTRVFPYRPNTNSLLGRAILERRSVQVEDVRAMPAYHNPALQTRAIYRTGLAVPMLREGKPIGGLALWRSHVQSFTERQIELVETFASQAVIAIENVRLFTELQARTAELTRSVDELTALGEVSRALSSTLNLEDVLQTIAKRATQLTETAGCVIWEYDKPQEEFRLRVSHYTDDSDAAILPARGGVTTISKGQGLTTQVMEERQPVQIPDIAVEGAYESPVRKPLIDAGHRALLGVPLLSEDEVVGVLAVTRKTPGEFDPEVIRLLSTFANQSALAIQNARLFQDIEEKSRQLEVASQHKSEFLANMSHELRTPLNAIIGFSEVLTDRMFGELNEKQEEYLKDIYASGTHLLSLINDILDLSKIEAGRMELELSDFHLPQAIENALTLVRERAGRRGIALAHTMDEHLGEVRGDERKIKQVLLNLLSNALKFTPEGGRVEVRAVMVDGMAEISVADTGVGIAPEDQEKVFEEFRQVGTAEKKAEGTGLGLTLCRKFIELHGGRIWVKSEPGAGSTFTFTIPARRGE